MRPSHAIRFMIVAALLIILILIGWNFVTQARRKQSVPSKSEEIASDRVEKSEKIEYFEVEGAKGNFKVEADRHYMGDDGKYHLEGEVKVVFFKKREGQDVHIHAQQIIYDEDWNHFFISGDARMNFKDILVESPSVDYDNKKEVFQTDKGVRFSSEDITGTAEEMTYAINKERLELKKNVFCKLKTRMETPHLLEVRGERLEYSKIKKKGLIEGNVFLTHGESRAWADSLEFDLFVDEEHIKNLIFRGRVKASIIDEEKEPVEEATSLIPYGAKREIKAEELWLKGYEGLSRIKNLEARGDSSIKFLSSEEKFTLIEGEMIEFIIDPAGELMQFRALNNARITEKREDSEETRIIEGESMTKEEEVLIVEGKKKVRPRILLKDNEIQANKISVFLDSNDVEVEGDVKMALQWKKEDEKSVGFFSKDRPIFISAQEMRYSEEMKRFLFRERTKMWQEKETITAKTVKLFEETGKIVCEGGVQANVPYKPQDREEERLEISAKTMDFKPEEDIVSFHKNGIMEVKDIRLKAKSIDIHLKSKEGDMDKILARENVVIVQGLRKGLGAEAIYDLEKDNIVLLGDPVLIDKDQGRVNGDKLTFYIGDGRIVVENKGRERSLTVIKS